MEKISNFTSENTRNWVFLRWGCYVIDGKTPYE